MNTSATVTTAPKSATRAAIDLLEEKVKELTNSKEFSDWLRFVAKFHRYSPSNILLIRAQRPDAHKVASYTAWRKMGGQVKKGAKAIRILAPHVYTTSDDDGNDVRHRGFHAASVFDISDVEGVDDHELYVPVEGDVRGYNDILAALCEIAPCPVFTEDISDRGCDGYYSRDDDKIVINRGMSQLQTIKTLLHEIAHSMLHNEEAERRCDPREYKEIQAESVAFAVSEFLGINSSDSTGYITTWGNGSPLHMIRYALDDIVKTADTIITGLETYLEKEGY